VLTIDEGFPSEKVRAIIEAALLSADGPVPLDRLVGLFKDDEIASDVKEKKQIIKTALKELNDECENRGVELANLAGGYRFQSKQDLSPWISRLWDEKPPRYTRALLETLAIIAYQQPVSRGDIEQIRGVAVSPNIMRTLIDREWVQSLGHREVPGRPMLYGTTRSFLDYFGVKKLSDLPPLEEIKQLADPVFIEAEVVAEEMPKSFDTEAPPLEE
jgi:segregation and condensation protein B